MQHKFNVCFDYLVKVILNEINLVTLILLKLSFFKQKENKKKKKNEITKHYYSIKTTLMASASTNK